MDCPACHAENAATAIACASCGHALSGSAADTKTSRVTRRTKRRRRDLDESEAAVTDSKNPAAWRAFRVALGSLVPGFGLLLGILAMILGWLAVRSAGDDVSGRNRAKAAIVIGAGSAVTQWLGVTLIYLSY